MTSDINMTGGPPLQPRWWQRRGPMSLAVVAVLLLVVGAAAGAVIHRHIARGYPQAVMLLQPTPIAKAASREPVAFKGKVAEIFGGDFILADDSGRSLVVTGPRGERHPPVTKDEIVTVQGFFDNGEMHAVVLVHADGSSEGFGPPGPPRGPGFGPGRGPGPHGFGPGGFGPGGFGPGGFGPGGPRGFGPPGASPAPSQAPGGTAAPAPKAP